ncbi:hypothetical protein [Arsenophonus nasoniae]|uniref:Uncharacterized protein n=1 Tax=Arsenophonus nasoniae TaxID=638 RepID=A0AA95K9G5_9GAMM|nr:hypothetical protein [Arsenophonus nasoniae]WGL97022.1 hypothetical protein QE207_07930 [Arsenophonus nasoniae]
MYVVYQQLGEVKRIELFARDKTPECNLWGDEAPKNNINIPKN